VTARATAPASVTWGWRAALVILCTAYGTVAALVVRGLVGGIGFGAADIVIVAAATLVAMLAIVPMAAVIDLPEALWEHWIPERRWRAGRCPSCGHESRQERCPECGAPFEQPASWAADWASLRRAAWVVLPAWALGTMAGAMLATLDESAFRAQVEVLRSRDPELRDHSRPRAWPASFAELRWNAGRGFAGPPPFESPKVAG
jgi:hypothetical protein